VTASYFPDNRFFGENGHLVPYDVVFDPDDAAHVTVRPDGSVLFRVSTEPGFAAAHLVLADGSAAEMRRWGSTRRWDHWQVEYRPSSRIVRYTFALRHGSGRVVYRVPAGIGNAVERLDRWELDLDEAAPLVVPEWMRGAVIYQIFPERFGNGDPANDPEGTVAWGSEPHWLEFQGGDLDGITGHIDHIAGLGVDLIYLNPILASPSTHKYDATDFLAVDPAFGGDEALRRLVAATHERGMRIILDVSINHCHPRFPPFADVVANGIESPYRDWFAVRDHPPRVVIRPHMLERDDVDVMDPAAYQRFLDRMAADTGLIVEEVEDDGPVVETTYECWYGVPTMPRVRLEHAETREYFLEVAAHWLREFDIDGYRLDVARYIDPEFWDHLRRTVHEVKPDAYLIAEIMGDAGPWVQGNQFDATMNYTFRELGLGYFADRSLSTEDFLDGFTDMLAMYAPEVTEVNQNLLASHDTERFLYMADEDRDRVVPALIWQLTSPGAPGIYYGEEIGMTGGHEPASRGAFPWQAPETWDEGLLGLVRELGTLRRDRPVLRRGDYHPVWRGEDAFAFLRTRGEERALVLVNRGEAVTATVAVAAAAPTVWFGDGAVAGGESIVVDVPAQSGLVIGL
jgi:glycosidase